jgi:hypothetical protein
MLSSAHIPLWLTLAYGLAVPVIAVVYWRSYGPTNFLWLSDVALAFTSAALITGNPLLASMPAVGVLALELAWTADFLTGGRIIGLAAYMFDPKLPLYLRALSLFHLALPPTLVFLLYWLGYDRRALIYQTLLTWGHFWSSVMRQPSASRTSTGCSARAASRSASCRHRSIWRSRWSSCRCSCFCRRT